MKKILFLGFFLAQLYAYPQTAEEDAIIDSVLDELFQTDTSFATLSEYQYLYTNLSFDENVFFAGRDFDINQFGFTPSISYMKGQNFFVSLGSAYFSELDPKWDFVSISTGYSLILDRSDRLSLSGIYSRIFFSADSDELNQNRLSAALAYHKNKIRLRLSAAYLFGGSATFYIDSSASYEIPLLENDQWEISFNPQLSLLMSEQTISEQIASGFFNAQIVERDVFDLINSQISIPLLVDIGTWDFQLSYKINLPKALASETNLNTSSYFSFSIGYFSPL